MIYYTLCFSIVLCIICYIKISSLTRAGVNGSIRLAFYNSAFELLLILSFVAGFYWVIAMLVSDRGSDEITIGVLREYERGVQAIRSLLDTLKLGPASSIFVLLVCLLVSMILRHRKNQFVQAEHIEVLYKKYGLFSKWLKRITLVFTALSSFTFFGGEVNAVHADLQVRIKTVKDNYSTVAADLEAAIKEGILAGILDQLNSEEFQAQQRAVNQSVQEFNEVSSEYLVSVAQVDNLDEKTPELSSTIYRSLRIERIEERRAEFQNNIKQWEESHSKQSPSMEVDFWAVKADTSAVSLSRIYQIEKDVKEYRNSVRQLLEPALKSSLGEELPPAILNDLLTHERIPLLKKLAEVAPVLELLASLPEEILSKLGGNKISRIVNNLMQKCFKQPEAQVIDGVRSAVGNAIQEMGVHWEKWRKNAITQYSSRSSREVETMRLASIEGRSKITYHENMVARSKLYEESRLSEEPFGQSTEMMKRHLDTFGKNHDSAPNTAWPPHGSKDRWERKKPEVIIRKPPRRRPRKF